LRDDLPEPVSGPDEVLVRVRMAGLCATDLEMITGYYPFTGIMGHEFVGEIAGTGQRVCGEINIACGSCSECLAGRVSHCLNRSVLGIKQHHGTLAEYLTLPYANLHPVPDELPDEAAVFTEPLAAALEIPELIHIHPQDRVLVVGAGRLGQLCAWVLAPTGCRLQVAARHPHQIELLRQRGIETIPGGSIAKRTYDVVVEATGSPDGYGIAFEAVRPRGALVLKSTYAGNLTHNMSSVVVNEIVLAGSRCGPFEPAIRMLASGRIDPRPLIEAVYPLEDAEIALKHASTPGSMKILVRP
jgi:threonine dehydrogenase-like Zn-dependent dehydrogenase